ncbi:sigma-70 family RNA polymerase sigma factor [Winogradskyella echinorum]|uniref:RNA polymerase sigma factor n=1 Tax=Winogradskyella echinorum TaxID=538189 RepID=A0ABR6Y2V3_9FLAO|nr:sigma-70 family RNA polymerase sigma factor [Winogradskyella echinorum]MBC3847057.1 sigma-70 family RNA polymerase sigma factor [Winogradskyella echinorum]MBC5751405.1 sigma-70 family RNA polymerase sigma factor [Winogradskyella echinorum]
MTTNDDQILITAIEKGDTKAYAQLVDRYKDLVYTLAIRMLKHKEEAEEVAQDTFIKVFKSLGKFKGDSKFSTWIYKVTYNTCLDRIKKNKKHFNDVAIDEYTFNKLDTIDNALDNIIKEEKSTLIKQCINKLPEDSSALLTLFYFEELSLDEISKIINLEANTVKVKLFRARKKLAVILEQYLQPQNSLNYGTR